MAEYRFTIQELREEVQKLEENAETDKKIYISLHQAFDEQKVQNKKDADADML